MRVAPGVLLCVLGVVWITQGVGWLKGSFMTGHPEYAYIGAVTLLAGIALLVWAKVVRDRRNANPPDAA